MAPSLRLLSTLPFFFAALSLLATFLLARLLVSKAVSYTHLTLPTNREV